MEQVCRTTLDQERKLKPKRKPCPEHCSTKFKFGTSSVNIGASGQMKIIGNDVFKVILIIYRYYGGKLC